MNSLEKSLQVDVSGYERVAPHEPPLAASEPTRALLPVRDVLERSPVPTIPGTFPSSDALRSYHLGGMVPQSRAPMPAPASAQGAGGTQITNVVSTSTSSTTTNTLPQIQVASISTPVLSPNTQFQTAVSLTGEAWNLFSISISPMAACRIRLYGTPAGQTGDASRNPLTPPGLGTEQDLIFDVLFDGLSGSTWDCQGVTGNNNQPGVSQLCFVTVDNLSGGSTAFSVTLQYSPLCQ
jgi:hypothetical protein